MRLLVYDMLVNVNGIYYVHVCEQARSARSARNSVIENLCVMLLYSPRQRGLGIQSDAWTFSHAFYEHSIGDLNIQRPYGSYSEISGNYKCKL